jgi:cyclic beta-1,2-glucan synthetase
MYRLIVESLLGVHRHGNELRIDPCLPAAWPGFHLRLRHGSTEYAIEAQCTNHEGNQSARDLTLVDDGQARKLQVAIPRGTGAQGELHEDGNRNI